MSALRCGGAAALGHVRSSSSKAPPPLSTPAIASAKSRAAKGFEVVDALADADEMHRQGEFVGDRDQNAAARGAVELGHHEAGDARGAAEDLDLAQRVLPDRGVEHEQHGVRRLGIDLPHHPDDLFEFAHQFGAILQSPRGVHQHDVDAKLAGAGQRVEGEPGRVGALVALDEGGERAPRPDAQLLDRRGAEGVARGEQHRLRPRP